MSVLDKGYLFRKAWSRNEKDRDITASLAPVEIEPKRHEEPRMGVRLKIVTELNKFVGPVFGRGRTREGNR